MCESIRLNGVKVVALLVSFGVAAGCVASRREQPSRLAVGDDTRDFNLQLTNESDPKRMPEGRPVPESEVEKCVSRSRQSESGARMTSKRFILPGVPRPSRRTERGDLASEEIDEPLGYVKAIYDGKYDLAVACAGRLIASDPSNAQALEILGSAYFLMDEKQEAKEAWQRALRLEPQNSFVAGFIDKLE